MSINFSLGKNTHRAVKSFIMIYNTVLILLAAVFSFKFAYQYIMHNKYRQSIAQRMGFGFPDIQKGSRKLVWVHAVSMGETKAIAPLIKELKKTHQNIIIVLSTVTETGHAEGKRSIPEADYHVYLPFDLSWIIRPIVEKTKPDLVILCESDFWYNFLKASKDAGASIVLVNGKLSERSLQRYKQFSRFSHSLFNLIDKFCLQSSYYKERFEKLGIPSDKIEVTGNIKMDGLYPKLNQTELEQWKQKFNIGKEDLVLVCGSTHNPEEKILLDCAQKSWQKFPNLFLFLVPRHPERFQEVGKLLEQKNIPYKLYSDLTASNNHARVILIDRMGLLRQCYQLADIAFVGGTLTEKVGGHNIMEPAHYGVPVIFGPYLHAQPEMHDLVKQYGSGIQVDSDNISKVIMELLADSSKRQSIGKTGLHMAQELTGAVSRTNNSINRFLLL